MARRISEDDAARRAAADAVARERRERLQRERERRRRAAAAARPARKPEPGAPAGTAVVRERHEGLVGWLARTVVELPRRTTALVAGFAHEVGRVCAGIGRVALRFVPGGRRLAAARPAVARRSAARTTSRPRGPRFDERRRDLLRRRLRVALGVGVLAAVGAAWLTVPGSDVFRIRHVEVTGTAAVGDLEVRSSIDSLLDGATVLTLDTDAVRRRLEALPFVRRADVRRHLPGGIEVVVEEYRPLALGAAGGSFWLVAHDGRILARADRDEWSGRVPFVTLVGRDLSPGDRVDDEPALRLLASRGAESRLGIREVRVDDGVLVATLAQGVQVRFGRPVELRQKLLAAERLVVDIAGRGGVELAYVDVVVPARPTYCERADPACSLPRGPRRATRQRETRLASDRDEATTPEELDDEPAATNGVGTAL